MAVFESAGMSRRRVLQLSGVAGGLAVAGSALGRQVPAAATTGPSAAGGGAGLPVALIERIVRAKGSVSDGVLNIGIERDDLPYVRKEGVPIKPSFQINGSLCFQALADGSTMLNGDLAFLPAEMNPAIDRMIEHGLAWQAQHQHLFGLDPMVFFMHFRGRGSARRLAEACAAVLRVTSTPLPQAPPKNPTTPLDTRRLAAIIGATPTVEADGVVSFDLPQREPIMLGGVHISPFLNVFTSVAFEPLHDRTVVVADFGLLAGQINPQARTMRRQGWQLDCLYNQETDEQPQLYFSHQFKVGNAYRLAREVRRGLEQTSVVLGA